ncbi:MAG: hypothetical protein IAF94_23335 [Pirellulaceae bacterium]|nr:hypothetical protein [Pirellulaceae bacterium]
MKTMTRLFFALGLVALIGVAFGAQDAKKGKKGGKRADPTAAIKTKLETLDLTSEQKEKIDKILAEQGPKVTAAVEKVNASLTDEQRKARNEAQKSAKAAGKKGKEANDEALTAMKLTDEQKKDYDAATKAQREANQALVSAVSDVLSPEQREKAKLGGGGGKKKKNKQ